MSNNYTSATTGVLGSFSSSLSVGFFKPFYWMSILKTKGKKKKKKTTKRRYGSLSSLGLIVYGFASFYFGYVQSLVLGCGIQERGKILWKCSFLAVLWVVWKKETVDVLKARLDWWRPSLTGLNLKTRLHRWRPSLIGLNLQSPLGSRFYLFSGESLRMWLYSIGRMLISLVLDLFSFWLGWFCVFIGFVYLLFCVLGFQPGVLVFLVG